jgi:predicted GNAT family acetyltransferase
MIDQRFLDDLAQDLKLPEDTPTPEMQLASANTGVTTDGGAFVGYRMNMPKGLNTRENMAKQSVLIADTMAGGGKGAVQGFVGLPGDLESIGRMALNYLGYNVNENTVLPTSEEIGKRLESVLGPVIPPNQTTGVPTAERERAAGGGELGGEIVSPGGQIALASKVAKPVMKATKEIIEAGKDLPVGMSIKGVDTKDFVNLLKNQIDGLELDLSDSSKGNVLTLSRIEIPKAMRKSGVGSQVMTEVTKFADENGKTIALSPSTDFGATSTGRLKDFYKQFGFVENKGRNKDFSISESMYRKPVLEENK